MRSCGDHLIVLRLLRTGEAEEIYNGPGELASNVAGNIQGNKKQEGSHKKEIKK